MDVLNIIFGGLGGAILTAIVALCVHHASKPRPKGQAYELLKKLQWLLQSSPAEYYFMKSATENYQVARLIYSDADAEVVATAFGENPETYGDGDLARGFRYGSLFTRVTCEEICPAPSASKARETLNRILRGATLVVIPKGQTFTRIDGIFCRFKDSTYLCVIAFRDPQNVNENKGVVFRDGIAQGFFEYYKQLVAKYEKAETDQPEGPANTSK